MIVDTEKVSREADGPVSNAGYGWKGGRPLGAPQRADGRADDEPEDHKRDEKAAYIQARSSMARIMQVNGKARHAEGKAKMV